MKDFSENIKKELLGNPKYKEFFSRFNPFSIEGFIGGYAHIKYMYTQFANLYEDEAEAAVFGMLDAAHGCLEEILQKKLFNEQCLWRAEKVQLQEVEQTTDFLYWDRYVFGCPFLEPITENDLELYMGFLNSLNTGKPDWMSGWQDYDEFKEAFENEDEGGIYPDWYEYYDTYKGTGMLIKLPDVRGKKEEFYRQLHFEAFRKKQMKDGIQPYVPCGKPELSSYDDQNVEEFIKLFETSQEMQQWKNYRDSKNNDDDELQSALLFLQRARETVSINAHSNWREAVMNSSKMLENRLIARALPQAYEDYKMKMETGISFYEDIAPIQEYELSKIVKEQIFEGRQLNGEPRDLNF